MNPITLVSFVLSVLVMLLCFGLSLFSKDEDRQSGAIILGITALCFSVATGVFVSQQWNATHPPVVQQIEVNK